jgi:hypothetical protein
VLHEGCTQRTGRSLVQARTEESAPSPITTGRYVQGNDQRPAQHYTLTIHRDMGYQLDEWHHHDGCEGDGHQHARKQEDRSISLPEQWINERSGVSCLTAAERRGNRPLLKAWSRGPGCTWTSASCCWTCRVQTGHIGRAAACSTAWSSSGRHRGWSGAQGGTTDEACRWELGRRWSAAVKEQRQPCSGKQRRHAAAAIANMQRQAMRQP